MASRKSNTSVDSKLVGQLRKAAGESAPETMPETEGAPAPILKALSKWDPEVLSRPGIVARLAKIGPEGRAFKCLVCGKILVSEDSQEFGSGHRCDEVVCKMSAEQWEAHYADMICTTPPEGWVRLNAVFFTAKKYGRSAGQFLKMCGGDRGDGEEKSIQVAYLKTRKGARFVPGTCLTAEFLKALPASKKTYTLEEMPADERKFVVEVEGM